MRKYYLSIILLIFNFIGGAQDRFFGRTYTSDILQKGAVDLELWHTSRFGHSNEFFHAMDQRMELEVGLGKRVQTAFYFNHFQKSFSDSSGDIIHRTELGFSNEWKWQVNNPLSKTHMALYGELGIKGDEIELETKLIMDRSFGKSLLAFNIVYEQEYEFEREGKKSELELEKTPFEFDLAFMHYYKPDVGIGIEAVSKNELMKGKLNNSLLYLGPSINYRADSWFLVLNYLPQLANLHKTAAYPHNKDLVDHERAEMRLVLGFSL
jgi:hypothetical protein